MQYIHQNPSWPDLTWNASRLLSPLAEVRHRQGRLLGRMENLGFELQLQASCQVMTEDVVRSSAIEGEQLRRAEVRSSVARRLGMEDARAMAHEGDSRKAEGMVEMILDATRNFAMPLTRQRLCDWHAALFPTGRSGMTPITVGAWRTAERGPMQVVSGPLGRERVHFEAPPAERLAGEMERFLDWFETTPIDPVLKSGVAHFRFVTIHPFEDGNGRIARAIADLALARAEGTGKRFYSISTQIERERKAYYFQLESSQRGETDITLWLEWYLGCLQRAINASEGELERILQKAAVWKKIGSSPVNERQRMMINRLLDGFEGKLTNAKYAKLAKCSSDTAWRDLAALLDLGILTRAEGGGRSTSYTLAE